MRPSNFPRRALTLGSLATLLACGGDNGAPADSGAAAEAATGGTLVVTSPGEPDALVHAYAIGITGRVVSDLIFDRLASLGDSLNTIGDGGFRPQLARTWTWAPDSLSIAFALDPRARFHDGRPVRANDVRFSFQRLADPAAATVLAASLADVDSVTVRDSLTAVVWFGRRSMQQFFSAVQNIPVMPEHVYGTVAAAGMREHPAVRQPVGSGRFRFVRWDAGQRVEIMSDTANYRGRARLDRVIWTLAPDLPAGIARLVSGEGDLLEVIPPAEEQRVEQSPNYRLLPYPNMQHAFLGMNHRAVGGGTAAHPVFGDVRVRRAISHAVDRQAMLRNVFGAGGQLAYGPFSRAGGLGDSTLVVPAYDTAAAAALLDSAGWRRGADGMRARGGRPLRFTLLVPTTSQARMQYATLLQEQLRGAGVQVEVEPVDFPTFNQRTSTGRYDASLQTWGPDPGIAGLAERWRSGSEFNFERYASPRFEQLVDSAAVVRDPARARATLREALATIVADAPAVWLYEVRTVAGVHDRVRPAPMPAYAWWSNLADWSIAADQRIARDRIGLAAPAATP